MQDRIKVHKSWGRQRTHMEEGKEEDDIVSEFLYRPSGGTISLDQLGC